MRRLRLGNVWELLLGEIMVQKGRQDCGERASRSCNPGLQLCAGFQERDDVLARSALLMQ